MAKNTVASISLPGEIIKEIEKVAKKEHRTKSGIVQDAVKQYLELRKWQVAQGEFAARARRLKLFSDDDVEGVVDEVRR